MITLEFSGTRRQRGPVPLQRRPLPCVSALTRQRNYLAGSYDDGKYGSIIAATRASRLASLAGLAIETDADRNPVPHNYFFMSLQSGQ